MEGDESNFGMAEQAAFYQSFTWRSLKLGHFSLLFLHHFKCLRLGPSWLEFYWLDIQDPTSFSMQSAVQMFLNLIFPDVVWWVCPNTLLLAQMPWSHGLSDYEWKWLSWAHHVLLLQIHGLPAESDLERQVLHIVPEGPHSRNYTYRPRGPIEQVIFIVIE